MVSKDTIPRSMHYYEKLLHTYIYNVQLGQKLSCANSIVETFKNQGENVSWCYKVGGWTCWTCLDQFISERFFRFVWCLCHGLGRNVFWSPHQTLYGILCHLLFKATFCWWDLQEEVIADGWMLMNASRDAQNWWFLINWLQELGDQSAGYQGIRV